MHPYFNVFGFPLPAYGLMGVVGIGVAALYLFFTNRGGRAGRLPGDDLLHILCLALVGALLGAKLLSILTLLPDMITHWDFIMATPGLLVGLLTTGYVFYGGFIGGGLMVWWYCRKYKISFKTTLGIVTPAIPLFHVFGRIGCFLGGCCYGIEVPFGVVYPETSLGAPPGIPLLPVPLIEAACNLLLFFWLAWLSRRIARKWLVFPAYVLVYAVLRFILEYFRGDAQRGIFLFSTSQWIALALATAVVILYFARWRKQPKDEPPPHSPPPPGSTPISGPSSPAS